MRLESEVIPMARTRKRKKRRNRLGRFLRHSMLCLFMIFALGFGVTVFFKVETITVEGNSHYSADEIISASQIQLGSNLFAIARQDFSSSMTYSLPYIQSISVKLSFPTGVRLVVEEQSGIVKLITSEGNWYMGIQGKLLEKVPLSASDFSSYEEPSQELGYWDEDGLWVDYELDVDTMDSDWENPDSSSISIENLSSKTMLSDVTIPTIEWNTAPDYSLELDETTSVVTVTGMEVVDPTVGMMIQVPEEDQRKLTALLSLFQELESGQILEDVSAIHVHVFQHFEFEYRNRFLVKFPFSGDFSYKLRALTAAVSETENYETGIMDLTQEHYAVLFTPD